MSRKRRQRKCHEASGDEEDLGSFSWWTPWRKFVGIAALVGCVGGVGMCVHSNARDARRKAEHEAHVESIVSAYQELPSPEKVVDTCLTPGSEARVFTDSVVIQTIQSENYAFTAAEDVKRGAGLCIRPVDGGQEVDLESKVLVSGLEYGDLDGFLQYKMGLKLVPEVPDIFPYDFSVVSVQANGRDIPLRYVVEREEDGRNHWYLDLNALVRDDILCHDDFGSDLELVLGSRLSIEEIPRIYDCDVAGISAFRDMPGIERYLSGDSDFPVDEGSIREVVEEYGGSRDNVMGVVRYVLDFTNSTLEYCRDDGSNCKGGRWVHVLDAMERGSGVCQAYSELFVTLCRSFGVPAKYVANHTLSSSGDRITGRHAWAEVLVPFRDGSYRWVLVEPTWSDDEKDPYRYINFAGPRHMYGVGLNIVLDTRNTHDRYDIFQEHHWVSTDIGGDDKGPEGRIDMPPVEINVRIEGVEYDGDQE